MLDMACLYNVVLPYLHSIVGVLVVEDENFLNKLVVSLQLVDLWLVVDDALFILAQVCQLVLQCPMHLNGNTANLLQRNTEGRRRGVTTSNWVGWSVYLR